MITAALAMGFLGSLHCVGMCGPIALAMPYGRFKTTKSIIARILYQLGRLSTYALLGLALGMMGLSIKMFGGQQYLSIALGTTLILAVLTPILFRRLKHKLLTTRFNNWVKNSLGKTIKIDSYLAFWFTGMLNGLLPCGLVWLALATALALSNGFESAVFMFFFGLGTVPALLGVLGTFQWLRSRISFSFNRISNIVALAIAVLLIVRGLNMGNYFSPYFDYDEAKRTIITICGFDE
jgi:hypothetical protein